jgi:hypothetical protein
MANDSWSRYGCSGILVAVHGAAKEHGRVLLRNRVELDTPPPARLVLDVPFAGPFRSDRSTVRVARADGLAHSRDRAAGRVFRRAGIGHPA